MKKAKKKEEEVKTSTGLTEEICPEHNRKVEIICI